MRELIQHTVAYVFSIVLLFLLFSILTSCHKVNKHTMTPRGRIGDIEDQRNRAVNIKMYCKSGTKIGSGFIFDNRKVLTAGHVITCDNPLAVKVCNRFGRCFMGAHGKTLPDHDAGLITLSTDTGFSRLEIAENMEKVLCLSPGAPTRVRVCGVYIAQDQKHQVMYSAKTYQGNSGSGLFTKSGKVLGIVTHTFMRRDGDSIGGLAVKIKPLIERLEGY